MASTTTTAGRSSGRSYLFPRFLLLAFVTATVTSSASVATGVGMCAFTSRQYAVGDVWYPRLGQRGALHCVACLCQEGGKINCTIHQCGSQECSGPGSATNECCTQCSTKDSKTTPLPTTAAASSLPPVDITRSSSVGSCLHNGNIYRHRERFTSNSIGLKPEHPDQCVQCSCESGMVLCQLRDCPKAECDNPIRTKEDCCPICPDPAGRVDEMDNSPVVISQQAPDNYNNGKPQKIEDCISGGRYYLHGSSWHPVMGPFGPMDCVNCQCRSGRIECARLECPASNCDRPVKVAGRCCPVCPLEPIDDDGAVTTVMRSSSTAVGKMPSTSFINSKSPSRGSASSTSGGGLTIRSQQQQQQQQFGSRPSSGLCLPFDYDSLVYRAQGGGNASEFIQYIFQRVVNGNTSEHHMWMLQPQVTTYKVQDLTYDQAEALRQRFRFVLLGSTSSKNINRFTKREKKLKPKCLPASDCAKKIRRLERNLTLKEVTSRGKGTCLPSLEIEASF